MPDAAAEHVLCKARQAEHHVVVLYARSRSVNQGPLVVWLDAVLVPCTLLR